MAVNKEARFIAGQWGMPQYAVPNTGNVNLAGGGRNLLTESGLLATISTFPELLKKTATGPTATALKETLGELVGGAPGAAKGAIKGVGGVTTGLVSGLAPKATREAIRRGAEARRGVLSAAYATGGLKGALGARQAARVAAIKPGIKIAGRWLGYRIPVLGAGLDLAAGDPLGAAGTAIGGTIGAFAGGPIGATVGSMVGGPILKGGRQILSPIFGDPTDPLSGRDWNPFGIPITPYAKTKRSMEKQIGLYKDIQLPLVEQIQNAQLAREMKIRKLGMMQNMLSETNRLMSNAYSASPY